MCVLQLHKCKHTDVQNNCHRIVMGLNVDLQEKSEPRSQPVNVY